MLLAVLLAGAPASEAAKNDRCPPKGHEQLRHCLLVQVRQTTPKRVAALVTMLKKDGFKAHRGDGDRDVVLHMNASELGRMFNAKYVYRRVAASATDRWACNAYVRGVRVPARYRAWIGDVEVGHQICE